MLLSKRMEEPNCIYCKYRRFQSLFFWMLLSKFHILADVIFPILFQSLFFWMLLSKLCSSRLSLLMLSLCFNPYFSGCFSLRFTWTRTKCGKLSCFNPYFSGCFSLRKHLVVEEYRHACRFQSLFFWMLLSKLDLLVYLGGIRGRSFNPYFSGCFSLSVLMQHLHCYRSISFNPYFSGCFSLSIRGVLSVALHFFVSFNPYFSGCFSLSADIPIICWADPTFQSLFFWMLLSKLLHLCRCRIDHI